MASSILLFTSLSLYEAPQEITANVVIDGIYTSIKGILRNGRIVIPVYDFLEYLNDGIIVENEQITLLHNGTTVILYINRYTAYINGMQHAMDTAAQIINGALFLPLRFVVESFGYNIDFKYGIVFITSALVL